MFAPTAGSLTHWALLTDLYELTMAYGYWKLGLAEREAVFHLSFRENPFGNSFSVACGLQPVCQLLSEYRFAAGALEYLASLRSAAGRPQFERGFLDYLGDLRLACSVDGVEEGSVVFPSEPLLRVRGPLLQAQILESSLLNVVNFQTLVATKAARICRAAGRDNVLEFGLRRAQGVDGALAASRAAYIGGCAATSNVLAGQRYGIPVRGTHAHSWVLCFDDERSAFEAYASVMPDNCLFLVDTYDTQEGVSHAVQVGQSLRDRGHAMLGIRLDSGDLAALSQQARRTLDAAGLPEAKVVASNDLDEYAIESLVAQGARIDIWGVGTRLVTAYDQPALGGVYKLSALRGVDGQWQYRLKLSEQAIKASTPGILQVRRFMDNESPLGDVIYDELQGLDDKVEAVRRDGSRFVLPEDARFEDLLVPIFRDGEQVYQPPSIHESRQRTLRQVARFRRVMEPNQIGRSYDVGEERNLYELKRQLAGAAGGAEQPRGS